MKTDLSLSQCGKRKKNHPDPECVFCIARERHCWCLISTQCNSLKNEFSGTVTHRTVALSAFGLSWIPIHGCRDSTVCISWLTDTWHGNDYRRPSFILFIFLIDVSKWFGGVSLECYHLFFLYFCGRSRYNANIPPQFHLYSPTMRFAPQAMDFGTSIVTAAENLPNSCPKASETEKRKRMGWPWNWVSQ